MTPDTYWVLHSQELSEWVNQSVMGKFSAGKYLAFYHLAREELRQDKKM
jgi:hypothetical protein